MASKLFRAVIMGAPASGKGTVSSRIVKKFNLHHISSGDKLRMHLKDKTLIGVEAKKYIEEGSLVPDSVMIRLIRDEISKLGNRSWLLDGFPRTLAQAEELWHIQKLNLVLNLVVPFNVIIERTKGRWVHLPSGRVYNIDFNAPKVPGKDDVTGEDLVQREDDKPEVVMKRLKSYEEMSKPLIEFYKNRGILKDFHGSTTDEIWPQVSECLSQFIHPLEEKVREN